MLVLRKFYVKIWYLFEKNIQITVTYKYFLHMKTLCLTFMSSDKFIFILKLHLHISTLLIKK